MSIPPDPGTPKRPHVKKEKIAVQNPGQDLDAMETAPAAAVVCAAPGGISSSIVLKLYASLMANQVKLQRNAGVPIHAKLTTDEALELAQLVEDAGGVDEVVAHYA